MKEVRIGVIGFGNMGSAHAHCIGSGKIQGLCLTAICDTDEMRRKLAKEVYPDVLVVNSCEKLFESGVTDAVIIATPHYAHPEIGIKAFAAGQHVLTEKPIAVSVSEGERLIRAAEEAGTVFAIMFNQRTNNLYRKAKVLVESGALGPLKRVVWIITNWYRTQSYYDSGSWRATWGGEGGGVLLNQAPHNLDLLQWICGMPVSLLARCEAGKYHQIEVEDNAEIYGELENGATVTFLASTGEYPGTNRLEISGGLGKLVIENGTLKWWKSAVPEREYCFHSEDYGELPQVTLEEYQEERNESDHGIILQNFADAIRKKEKLIAAGEEGIRELMISNGAYYSSWTHSLVELPVDREAFDRLLREKQEQSVYGAREKQSPGQALTAEYKEKWRVKW